MIRFLAEISLRIRVSINPTPSNDFVRNYNIYEVDLRPYPRESYWLDWGGRYDNHTGTQLELYYGRFLQHVVSPEELTLTPFSILIHEGFAYLNIPKHPWLYSYHETEGEEVVPFLSAALDPDNPSGNFLRSTAAKVMLEVPNFTVKLSDNVSGITLNQGFSLGFINNDGYFDDDDVWDLFNTPVHLKKAIIENPSYEDFTEIRSGYAESSNTSFDKFSIDVSDKLRSMGEPVCDAIQQDNFIGIPLLYDTIGKNIPVIYGKKKIKPIALDGINKYLLAESVTGVSNVVDKDGNALGYTLSTDKRVLTITSTKPGSTPPEYLKPETALVTGYTANTIGEIIVSIISSKTAIRYNASNWNTGEVNAYIQASPKINIVFTSGDVKKAIQDVLKSDMAYFIQQTDGRFTIRKWGVIYNTHVIPQWAVTQKPGKDFDKAQENYFSSCKIKYNFSGADRNQFSEYLFSEMENAAEDRYRKRVLSEYETDLIQENDVIALSRLLGMRYTVMRQRLKFGIGIDTSGFQLLDRIVIKPRFNERYFSKALYFVIIEINPAQDILTLEEIDVYDLSGEYPITKDYEADYDNMYGDTSNEMFEYILEGGEAV